LPTELAGPTPWPDGFRSPRVVLPGVLAVEGPAYRAVDASTRRFCESIPPEGPIHAFPLVLVVDDSEFVARSLRNVLWVTFTRSNPAADIDGLGAFVADKHWGCTGPLVIDARIKPQHAPPLVDDPEVERRVDALGAPGGPLHGII